MKPISEYIYIAIGLVVAITAMFNEKLIIFVFVGIILFGYGVFKAVYKYINKPAQKEKPKYCQYCRQSYMQGHKFCQQCGTQLRK